MPVLAVCSAAHTAAVARPVHGVVSGRICHAAVESGLVSAGDGGVRERAGCQRKRRRKEGGARRPRRTCATGTGYNWCIHDDIPFLRCWPSGPHTRPTGPARPASASHRNMLWCTEIQHRCDESSRRTDDFARSGMRAAWRNARTTTYLAGRTLIRSGCGRDAWGARQHRARIRARRRRRNDISADHVASEVVEAVMPLRVDRFCEATRRHRAGRTVSATGPFAIGLARTRVGRVCVGDGRIEEHRRGDRADDKDCCRKPAFGDRG